MRIYLRGHIDDSRYIPKGLSVYGPWDWGCCKIMELLVIEFILCAMATLNYSKRKFTTHKEKHANICGYVGNEYAKIWNFWGVSAETWDIFGRDNICDIEKNRKYWGWFSSLCINKIYSLREVYLYRQIKIFFMALNSIFGMKIIVIFLLENTIPYLESK